MAGSLGRDLVGLGPLVRSCVVPEDGAVVVAGATARLASSEDPVLVASQIRLALLERLIRRWPSVEGVTWEHFLSRVAEAIRPNQPTDGAELTRLLVQTVDGL